jgi:ABC-2 type transport system permease protein
MFAEFKNTFRRLRGQMIGWGLGLFLYDLMMSSFYSSIEEMGSDFSDLLASYPQEMLAFFPNIMEFTSPLGYLDTYFFSMMTVIIGIFAITTAKLVVGDEEKGYLDVVLSYPVSRTALFWGRFLAYLSALVVILVASWAGWLIPAESAGLELTAMEFLLPYLPLFAVLVVFGGFALLMSFVMPAVRAASSVAGALMVISFLMVGLANINPDLEPVFKATPLAYFQGAYAIEGLNWEWLAGLIGAALVCILVAWLLFQRRDIRVGGESGWGFELKGLLKRG